MLIINKITNISKITSSSARLIDATVTSLLFSWYSVFVVLTLIMQAYNLRVTKHGVASIQMAQAATALRAVTA